MSELRWLLLGLGVFALGAVSYRYGYRLTLYGEQLDAVGSKTAIEDVEPADWNVFFTKAIGVVLMVGGGLYAAVMAYAILG